jgi:hypothetical protein
MPSASFSTLHFFLYIAIIPLPFCTTLLGSGGRGREDGGGEGGGPAATILSLGSGWGPTVARSGQVF